MRNDYWNDDNDNNNDDWWRGEDYDNNNNDDDDNYDDGLNGNDIKRISFFFSLFTVWIWTWKGATIC